MHTGVWQNGQTKKCEEQIIASWQVFVNYRPISILLAFSKIIEKLAYTRIVDFLDKYDIYKFQFGFRKGLSTDLAIQTLVEKYYDTIERTNIWLEFVLVYLVLLTLLHMTYCIIMAFEELD